MRPWLRLISHINPLTYIVDALRTMMLAGDASMLGLDIDLAVILTTTSLPPTFTHGSGCDQADEFQLWPPPHRLGGCRNREVAMVTT